MQIVDGKEYIPQVRDLILEYADCLGRDLSFQNIEDELKNPAKKYTAPEGELFVAVKDGRVSGMIAYHRHSDVRCEMKRLYVRPECRGEKLGERLIAALLQQAKKAGYREMVLDTILPLQAAIHLYRKMGFQECAPYYENPMEDVVYFQKFL